MKRLLCLILFLSIYKYSTAATVDYFCRSDSVLNTTNTSSKQELNGGWSSGSPINGNYYSDVYIVHSNDSTTQIGSNIALSSTNEANGYLSATWVCPATDLVVTDKLRVVQQMNTGGQNEKTVTFTSVALGWLKLNSATWTFKRSVEYAAPYILDAYYGDQYLFWGASTDECKVSGIDYTLAPTYSDIGIRFETDSGTINIGTEALDGHKLRVRKGDTTYGIPLIATDAYKATSIRIYDGSNTKTIPEAT